MDEDVPQNKETLYEEDFWICCNHIDSGAHYLRIRMGPRPCLNGPRP